MHEAVWYRGAVGCLVVVGQVAASEWLSWWRQLTDWLAGQWQSVVPRHIITCSLPGSTRHCNVLMSSITTALLPQLAPSIDHPHSRGLTPHAKLRCRLSVSLYRRRWLPDCGRCWYPKHPLEGDIAILGYNQCMGNYWLRAKTGKRLVNKDRLIGWSTRYTFCGTMYLSHCRTTPAATLTFWGHVTSSVR